MVVSGIVYVPFFLRPAGVQFDLDANMLITGLPLERGTPSVAPTQVSGTFVDGRNRVVCNQLIW